MGVIYKPFGIVLGILAGALGRQLFNFVWEKLADEEPPEPTTEQASWRSVVAACALQGMIYRVTRVVVDRYGAIGWSYLTGVWPGEKTPEPD